MPSTNTPSSVSLCPGSACVCLNIFHSPDPTGPPPLSRCPPRLSRLPASLSSTQVFVCPPPAPCVHVPPPSSLAFAPWVSLSLPPVLVLVPLPLGLCPLSLGPSPLSLVSLPLPRTVPCFSPADSGTRTGPRTCFCLESRPGTNGRERASFPAAPEPRCPRGEVSDLTMSGAPWSSCPGLP